MKISHLTKGKRTIAVVCNQWGDTGKGKIISMLAEDWADIVIRGTGGSNAGHTLFYKGKKYVCHLLPSGIAIPGVINVIGRGVALNLDALSAEMQDMADLSFKNLLISHDAGLVMPYHLLEDLVSPKSKMIGTTGSGIGPFYSDYYSRISITINDLLNKEVFLEKLNEILDIKEAMFRSMPIGRIKTAMTEKYRHKFHEGRFFDEEHIFDRSEIADHYLKRLAPMFREKVINADAFITRTLSEGKKILLEGAQGTLLSIDYGTSFFQTSSDCSIEGLAKGCGLKVSDIDLVLGIAKAPYMTRVGNGPFPTEFGGRESESYCTNARAETEKYLDLDKNAINLDHDQLVQGIAIRIKGEEYGATTGRARRTGWLDLVALKYSVKINGPNLILTKFDVMTGVKKIKLCVGYKYHGPSRFYGDGIIDNDFYSDEFIRDSGILYNCEPIFREFNGWQKNLNAMRSVSELPEEVKDIMIFIQNFTGAKIVALSVGPRSEETVFLNGDLG